MGLNSPGLGAETAPRLEVWVDLVNRGLIPSLRLPADRSTLLVTVWSSTRVRHTGIGMGECPKSRGVRNWKGVECPSSAGSIGSVLVSTKEGEGVCTKLS